MSILLLFLKHDILYVLINTVRHSVNTFILNFHLSVATTISPFPRDHRRQSMPESPWPQVIKHFNQQCPRCWQMELARPPGNPLEERREILCSSCTCNRQRSFLVSVMKRATGYWRLWGPRAAQEQNNYWMVLDGDIGGSMEGSGCRGNEGILAGIGWLFWRLWKVQAVEY